MKNSNCIICGKKTFKDLNCCYIKCQKCGLVLFAGKISQSKLSKIYTGGWLKSLRRKLLTRFRKFEHWGQFNNFLKKADKITCLVQNNINSKETINILDIGCNKGFLLSSSIKRGWNVHGIELVGELLIPFKIKYKSFAKNIYISNFENVYDKIEKEYFDVITAIDVIEHFENPSSNMKKIFTLLKPGGILVIQTPDTGSKKAKVNKWGALKPFEHLFLFNKKNYKALAEQAGFKETIFYKPFEEADGNFTAISKKFI